MLMLMLANNNSSLSLLQQAVYRSVDVAESRYKCCQQQTKRYTLSYSSTQLNKKQLIVNWVTLV